MNTPQGFHPKNDDRKSHLSTNFPDYSLAPNNINGRMKITEVEDAAGRE
jgi:hypothetical protein